MLTRIHEYFRKKSPEEKLYLTLTKKENPYIFKQENYQSWGNLIKIDNGTASLRGSFVINPMFQDGDLLAFECKRGIALCKVYDIRYCNDPYDMVEKGNVFQYGLIDKDGNLIEKLRDFIELTKEEKEALNSYFKEGKQLHKYKGFLV